MTKFFSLLKVMMSQDMNIFKIKSNANDSSIKKAILPLLLAALILFSIGTMYYGLAFELANINMTHVILSFAIAIPSLLALVEGIYKSQGILFEAKDSELLFSLPISKKAILLGRITKLYAFQLLYSLLFVLPGIAVYAMFEKTTAYFYIITTLVVLLFPIIPTSIGAILGFWIKKISVKFKSSKYVQLALTMAFFAIFMLMSFNSNDMMNNIVSNSDKINNSLINSYFPISAYQSLIKQFDLIILIELLALNIIAVFAFVMITKNSYFSVSSKSKEVSNNTSKKSNTPISYKSHSVIYALIKKEFNRYTSSMVYMFNTLFGLVLLIIATVALCTNFDNAITQMASSDISVEDIETLRVLAPKIFLALVIAMSFLTSITSSSISLEGKSFGILKCIPVKSSNVLLAKALLSNIITIPVILICNIIFFCFNNVSILDMILIIVASFIAPSISAVFGLIVNLKFPKMNASSDTEVVKQSTSSLVAVFGGMLLAGIFGIITFVLAGFGDYAMIIEDVLLFIILAVLWLILTHYGKRRFREIEV